MFFCFEKGSTFLSFIMFYFLLSFSFLALVYIYGGYYYTLRFIIYLRELVSPIAMAHSDHAIDDEVMPLTVYFPAFNEEEKVTKRLDNIFSCEFPDDKLEVIVVSDGSTDNTALNTNKYIDAHPDFDIKLIDFKTNHGRAHAQNIVAKTAKYGILVSTDADSIFHPDALREISFPFNDDEVGVAGGIVVYNTVEGEDGVGGGYVAYRGMESNIRFAEMSLKIMCKTDGPFTAYRKEIWRDIETFEDVDQIISIFSTKMGLQVVQAEKAICYDKANSHSSQDIKQRSRMTRKGLLSIFNRWNLSDFSRYPGFSFALFSHKVIRYFSPLFLLVLVLTIGFGLLNGYLLSYVIFISALILSLLVFILSFFSGGLASNIFRLVRSFFVAQVGFASGIFHWVRGDTSGVYTPTRKIEQIRNKD